MTSRKHEGRWHEQPRPDARRRRILQAAGALTLAGMPLLNAACALDKGGIRQRRIPGTDRRLPVVGLGSSGTFESGPRFDASALREVLRLFAELGGEVVDTSPTYGDAESNIGEMARALDVREQLFMATKVHARGREAGIEQMQDSLQTLGAPVELMQVHNLVDVQTQLKTLREYRDAGRIRYLGVTHYRVDAFDALEKLMREAPLDFVQFNYSIVTPAAEQRLLPLAADRGIAVLVNRAFEDGRLFGLTSAQQLPEWAAEFDCESWAQFYLKYVLGHPAVTCVLPATSNPHHLVDNMSAGVGALPEDEATRKRMRRFMADIGQTAGS